MKDHVAKVLVVDDSLSQRMMLAHQLRQRGFEVFEAGNGQEALNLIQQNRIHVVVSDWLMPMMSGLELCREMRLKCEADYVYFVLVTSKSERADLLKGFEVGVDDFIVKPVDSDELTARVIAGARVAKLHDELNERNKEIAIAHDDVARAFGGLQSDLSAAARFLETLIPPVFQKFAGAGVASMFRPSHLLGGDILGCLPLPEGQLAVYSIDVSGHGVSSALLSVMLSQAILPSPHEPLKVIDSNVDHEVMPVREPAKLVQRLNQSFQSEERSGLYFTIAYAVIDLNNGQVRLCQAGHPHPMVISPSGKVRAVGNGGLPVGLFAEAEFEEIRFELQPGERLMLYSDGISESENASGQQMGEKGLSDMLMTIGNDPLDDLPGLLLNGIDAHSNGTTQADDLSALVMSYDGCLGNCPHPCGTNIEEFLHRQSH